MIKVCFNTFVLFKIFIKILAYDLGVSRSIVNSFNGISYFYRVSSHRGKENRPDTNYSNLKIPNS